MSSERFTFCFWAGYEGSRSIFYGINFVPIKMNVIFQETYENINWNGIKCLWKWKNK